MPASSSTALKQPVDGAPQLVPEQPVPVLPILGMPVHDLGWNKALALLERKLVSRDGFTHIAFLNANNANVMVRDPEYRDVLSRCLVLPDGIGVDVAAQFLHGATFALAHLGAMYFILKAVPPRLTATAQSLYSVFSAGMAMGLATLACGPLYAAFGGRTYLLMSAMGAGAVLFALLLDKRWHGGRITQHADSEEDVISI